MNRINEFNIEPGVYRHYKGGMYVVTDIVTHMDNPTTGRMEPLQEPLVVYRDLEAIVKHVNGKPRQAHQVYARPLSEFTALVDSGLKRFKQL